MKSIYILLFLFLSSYAHSQIVSIPDANFKNALLNTLCADTNGDGVADADADVNNDGEIQQSEANAVLSLFVINKNIDSLEGIQYFTNLQRLDCSFNDIVSLNTSQSPDLIYLNCHFNELTSLDVSQNINLQELICDINYSLDQLDILTPFRFSGIQDFTT